MFPSKEKKRPNKKTIKITASTTPQTPDVYIDHGMYKNREIVYMFIMIDILSLHCGSIFCDDH